MTEAVTWRVTVGGREHLLRDEPWTELTDEGPVLVLPLEGGGDIRLLRPVLTSLKFDGLEGAVSDDECVTLIGNNKVWAHE